MAEKKSLIGQVPISEAQRVEPLIERINGLKELLMIVTDDEIFSNKINEEITVLEVKRDLWWDEMLMKNNWHCHPLSDWEIDLENGDVFI